MHENIGGILAGLATAAMIHWSSQHVTSKVLCAPVRKLWSVNGMAFALRRLWNDIQPPHRYYKIIAQSSLRNTAKCLYKFVELIIRIKAGKRLPSFDARNFRKVQQQADNLTFFLSRKVLLIQAPSSVWSVSVWHSELCCKNNVRIDRWHIRRLNYFHLLVLYIT